MSRLFEGQFTREPRAQVYRDCVGVLGTMAERALLVIREGTQLSHSGQAVLDELRPWLITSGPKAEWPGTKLFGATADVGEFVISRESIAILQTAVDGLYEWRAPFPEDLALLRGDTSVMLYSVGHEEEGGISLYESERATLLAQCPAISACVMWRE